MGKYNQLAKIVAIFSITGIILFLGLLEYHRSFDPYSWLNPNRETVYSRNLWNQRKEIYVFSFLACFSSFLVSITFLLFNWILQRRNRINLK
ncbi:MAG: hypothetical protein K1X72_23110 [Pyrinomonadaceae bacterium]|nr:hypothetical protein [Pyrinomonadaceae bacterium]